MIGKLGRLPAQYNPFAPKLARYMTEQVPDVTSVDYTTNIHIPWQMFLNDQLGCCTISGIGHLVMTFSAMRGDERIQMITDKEIETYYEILGNYVPGDASTDNGCVMTNVLNYWMNPGITVSTIPNKISGYSYLNPKNTKLIRWALKTFGGLYIGVQLPKYCEDHDYWDAVPNAGGILGGHCFTLQGMDDKDFYGISWGARYKVSASFLATYCDEMYVVINEDFVSPDGLDGNTLMVDLGKLKSNSIA